MPSPWQDDYQHYIDQGRSRKEAISEANQRAAQRREDEARPERVREAETRGGLHDRKLEGRSALDDVGEAIEDVGHWIYNALDDVWEWVSGKDGRDTQAKIREENMALWGELGKQLPSDDSDAGRAEADPWSLDQQQQALQAMQGVDQGLADASQGRYGAIEEARQQRIFQDMDARSRAREQAIQQQATERGMGRSGTALIGGLNAAQQEAQTGNTRSLEMEALAQQRALQAMQARGQLAGARSQATGQRATDTFNRRFATGSARDSQRQQGFQNRADIVAGQTGQYDRASATARQNQEDNWKLLSAAGSVVDKVV